ncbi:MAG: hypothetical protein CME06_18135 [Gemmatimonadetes bacterium]|nr:hypothetical protein [Gemmatimonadota bacterium]
MSNRDRNRSETAARERQWRLLATALVQLARETSSDGLLMRLLDLAMGIVPQAERGLVTLDEKGHGFPDFRVGRGVDGSEIPLAGEVSRHLLAEALDRDVVLSNGLHADRRFLELESVRRNPDRSVVLVGFAAEDTLRGVLYLEARNSEILLADDRKERLLTLTRAGAPLLARVQESERAKDLSRYHDRLFAGELDLPDFVVVSPAMGHVVELALRIASSANAWPVLIAGESGTGKELVARAIHENGERRQEPFVKVECGGLSSELGRAELFGHEKGAFTGAVRARKGLAREAHGGTLFLDDVDKLDRDIQAAMLRAIQFNEVRPVGMDRPLSVDFRVVATTSRDLRAMAQENTFLPDLFGRLTGWILALPPLRERPEEIVPLARRFAQKTAHELSLESAPELTDGAASKLLSHDYRDGNVRELEQAVRRAVALSKGAQIMPDLIAFTSELLAAHSDSLVRTPLTCNSGATLPEVRADAEREHIRTVLEAQQSREEAARVLGVCVATLYSKMNLYGLRRQP